jgi:hypothetical protein
MGKVATEAERLDKIEKQVEQIAKDQSLIAKEVSKISGFISRAAEGRLPPTQNPMESDRSMLLGGFPWDDVNPWALQAAIDLRSALASDIAPLQTYHDTLNALKSTEEGYTAEEVSQKTGKSRNTESGYMHRLYKAGYLRRIRSGKKVKYALRDKEVLTALFQEK